MMKKDEKKTILIIGDWFIDENWLVAKHKSYSSSHTGDIHYLSKHTQIDKRMISLCGAPEVLEVLRSYFANSKPHYLFKGFGVWNKEDDDILKCILCPDHTKNQYLSPYTIKSLLSINKTICPYSKKECKYMPCLINIAQPNQASTNRIIRVYEGYKGGQPHLLYRFDWELPILKHDLDYAVLEESIGDPKTVKAVIIVDHGKGVINDSTVRKLISLLKKYKRNVEWYIRTKINNPTWMDKLAEAGIKAKLKVIDEKLAGYSQGQRRWTFGKDLGRGSLEILGILTGDRIWKHGNEIAPWGDRIPLKSDRCAVIFDDNTAIAKHKQECYNLCDATGPKQLINIGHTTMFFNALIAQDLSDEFKGLDFGTQCWNAMECGFDWSKQASSAWNKEELYFYGNYQKALHFLAMKNKPDRQREYTPSDYRKLWAKWNDSSRKYGIVMSDKKLHVWRGEGAIEGYICVGGPKRNAINDLLSKISDFHDQKHPKQPFNCLFVSSPGWGKSYLARCMAKHFEMNFMEFSLSQMATTRDLIDCFDTICSFQNRTQEKVLIFMDEINCNIEGHPATGLLLSPIWDGSFIRDGKMYKLSPAVWIFASTETTQRLIEQRKGSDFVSRLNGPIIELDKLCTKGGETISVPINNLKNKLGVNPDIDVRMEPDYKTIMGLHGEFKTEQVYLGISLLNKLWGPISCIQKGVLMLFHDILPINGFRSLEFFVSRFRNIQRGVVALSNVPIIEDFDELKRHVVLPQGWGVSGGKYDKQGCIEIVTLPQ